MTASARTIVLFRGDSNFGNIGSMVPSLAAGFEEAGHRTRILNLGDADVPTQLRHAFETPDLGAFVSVSGFGLPPAATSPAVGLFNGAGVPTVGVFLDHPFQLRDRIDLPLENYHACFPAGHAEAFARRHIRDTLTYHHLPHGADPRPVTPWKDRDITLLLTGSLFLSPDAQRAGWRDHGADAERQLNDIVDLARQDLTSPLEQAVAQVAGEDLPFERLYAFMRTADDYLRNAHRLDCVRAVKDLPLSVAGPGWEALADELPGVNFLGEVSISHALELTDRSKAVLNPFPGYNDSHERIFNAMAGGTGVITNRSPFVAAAFDHIEISFLANDPVAAAGPVAEMINDETRLAAMAEAGHKRFLTAHTWAARARSILDWIDL